MPSLAAHLQETMDREREGGAKERARLTARIAELEQELKRGRCRPPERIPKVIGALMQAWGHYPDQRLGQLLMNIVEGMTDEHDPTGRKLLDAMWHAEADVWLQAIGRFMGHPGAAEAAKRS